MLCRMDKRRHDKGRERQHSLVVAESKRGCPGEQQRVSPHRHVLCVSCSEASTGMCGNGTRQAAWLSLQKEAHGARCPRCWPASSVGRTFLQLGHHPKHPLLASLMEEETHSSITLQAPLLLMASVLAAPGLWRGRVQTPAALPAPAALTAWGTKQAHGSFIIPPSQA